MSRKSKRNQSPAGPKSAPSNRTPESPAWRRWASRVGTVLVLLVFVALASMLFRSKGTQSWQAADEANRTALASEHSPTLGEPTAAVHIVEFLDPACETCATFFPIVKQLLAENPGRIRLSVRHVAFHEGSDHAVKVLEASRGQDKYWETLEALFDSQPQWAPNHTVQPDLVLQAIAGVGLDVERLKADMDAPQVAERIQRDRDDAMAMKVTATPEYFVNGRPLPSFGVQQLKDLVNEELQRSP
jgi:protein-disulfide isomerase